MSLHGRAEFYIEWETLDKDDFLNRLKDELMNPGKAVPDSLLVPYMREGILSVDNTAARLAAHHLETSATASWPLAPEHRVGVITPISP